MLILASNSPRRKEILSMLGYDFSVLPSNYEEDIIDPNPENLVKKLAYNKAKSVITQKENVVIGADTIVFADGKILGKPKSTQDAKDMLSMLSGKTHTVYTGISVISGEKEITDCVKADVTFRNLKNDEIDRYIASGEPMDKAGSYGIQGKGAALIEKISGDFFTVMGLPASRIYEILNEFGIKPNK